MKRLFGILTVMLCATSMSYAQADEIVTVKTSDIEIPLNGAAANGKVIKSGSCGKNVSYELYDDYTLRIYGNGAMDNFMTYRNVTVLQPDQAPWGIELYKKIKAVVIENGVTHIGGNSFHECSALTKVTISNSVKSIGMQAFRECTSLTMVTIPNSVNSIEKQAFSGCSSLVEISIPNSITFIDEMVFEGCAFTKLTIPSSVTSIGESAFAGCSFTEITIPSHVKSIGRYAFAYSETLKKVNISNGVTSLGDCAFFSCNKLKYVKIGKDITEIGDQSFPQDDDDDLVIEITSKTPAALSNVEAFGFLCTIYVPETALETYLNAKWWKDHADQIMPKNNTTGINSIGSEQSEKKTVIYDLRGNKVKEMLPNGIYIVNGKKVMK